MVVGRLVAAGSGDSAEPGESRKDEGCIGDVAAGGQIDLDADVGFGDRASPRSPGKGVITSKIKHAIKLKTRHTRLAHLCTALISILF